MPFSDDLVSAHGSRFLVLACKLTVPFSTEITAIATVLSLGRKYLQPSDGVVSECLASLQYRRGATFQGRPGIFLTESRIELDEF